MKCKGIDKAATRKNSKTIYCNTELHPHQIFCHVCGHATDALKTDLSAWQNLKKVWQTHKKDYSNYLMLGVVLSLFSYITALVIFFLFRDNYWLTNLVLLFTVPVLLIPFAQKGELTFSRFRQVFLKFYPSYWVFVLLAEIYFFALKVVCAGFLLDFMIDPVLHIVRLIMVLYGIACALIAPLLIGEKNLNPLKSIIESIKAGHETRWQLFFTSCFVVVINFIGMVCILAGLLVTLPLSYRIIRGYYQKMEEYELFRAANPTLELDKNSS